MLLFFKRHFNICYFEVEFFTSNAISIISNGIELFMPFEDLVDINEEIERLEKNIKELNQMDKKY